MIPTKNTQIFTEMETTKEIEQQDFKGLSPPDEETETPEVKQLGQSHMVTSSRSGSCDD